MSILAYKWIHLTGIFLFFISIGAHLINIKANDSRASRFIQINMGTALLIILIAGFGMLAHIKLVQMGWISVKIVIWLLLAFMIVLIKKLPKLNTWFWYGTWFAGLLAAYMALYKPF